MNEARRPEIHDGRSLTDSSLGPDKVAAIIDSAFELDNVRRVEKGNRPQLIIYSVMHALEIDDQTYRDPLNDAHNILNSMQHELNRMEFGDAMYDIYTEVEAFLPDNNILGAFKHLREHVPDLYRDELIEAHRLTLIMLWQAIPQDLRQS